MELLMSSFQVACATANQPRGQFLERPASWARWIHARTSPSELSRWIADEAVQVVITSGGTGLTGRDGTPEAVEPLLDKTIEGFGELFRVLSFETIGTSSLQSRCLAGVANGTVVFVLPGSLDAVETAWDRLIAAQLDATTRPCNLVQLFPRLREAP